LHGVLVLHAGGFLAFLWHASVELKMRCVGRGTPNWVWLKRHHGSCQVGVQMGSGCEGVGWREEESGRL